MRISITCISLIALLVGSVLTGDVTKAEDEQFSPVYMELMEKLEDLNPHETIQVKMGVEKERYDIGDPFEIRFQASEDSYITLMDISTNGDITFIAPSQQVRDTQIEGGRVYSTLYDFDLNITIAPPIGVEVINLFCSAEKVQLFETTFEQTPFYTISKDDEEELKQLIARLDRFKDVEWSGSSVKVLIGPQSRAVPRKY
ncbi:DUF4384 domain-containing protein, partial [candidate division KSB3 bacterium]|nr:DUF4384 domain-containing protein [candidate division KSB3 bacterium]MBD3323005.1 DUF4384 domain-containing protein [candidate division KSB3 bacterium]